MIDETKHGPHTDARARLADLAQCAREFHRDCRHRERLEARAQRGPAWLRHPITQTWARGRLVEPTRDDWRALAGYLGPVYIFQFEHDRHRALVTDVAKVWVREPPPEPVVAPAVCARFVEREPPSPTGRKQGLIFWAVVAALTVAAWLCAGV